MNTARPQSFNNTSGNFSDAGGATRNSSTVVPLARVETKKPPKTWRLRFKSKMKRAQRSTPTHGPHKCYHRKLASALTES